MRVSRLASKVHKWLALIIGLQIILWFATGWFISFFPIERVRGEHLARPLASAALPADALPLAIREQLATVGPITRLETRMVAGRPLVQVDRPANRPMLFDLASGRKVSPVSADMARSLAIADYAGTGTVAAVRPIVAETPQYRGPLPAWRVEFADDEHTALYVAADTAKVLARRTDLWRIYDFLWGLHIMDWGEHENINHWWLWATAALSLTVALTGTIMFPSRFKWGSRRRRAKVSEVRP